MNENKHFIIFTSVLSISCFILFLYVIHHNIDVKTISFVYSIRNNYLNSIFIRITNTGDFFPALISSIFIVIALFYFNKKVEASFYVLNILGIWVSNIVLKMIFERRRPQEIRLVDVSSYSFPSGHAMVSMAVCLLIIYFIITFVRNKLISVVLSSLVFMYSLLIGISRVYVGVHYVSDVLGGWMAAGIWTIFCILIYKKMLE